MSNSGGRAGRVVVISGPSGAGKSSVIRRLLDDDRFWLSVSATTRAPRPGEEHGRHYLFLDRDAFERLRDEGGFLEWAEVHGNLYGTPKAPLDDAVAAGRVALLDIDTQGARSLRALGVEATFLFVQPPSLEVLEARLRGRGTESAASLNRRLGRAAQEMREAPSYDVVVVNDDLERCVRETRDALLGAGASVAEGEV
jgi:guanylate kinase